MSQFNKEKKEKKKRKTKELIIPASILHEWVICICTIVTFIYLVFNNFQFSIASNTSGTCVQHICDERFWNKFIIYPDPHFSHEKLFSIFCLPHLATAFLSLKNGGRFALTCFTDVYLRFHYFSPFVVKNEWEFVTLPVKLPLRI